jgi:hypothetical protein
MESVGNGMNLKQAASSRLNNIGNIEAHSAFMNDPKALQHMQEKWLLAKPIGTVSAFKEAEVQSKTNVEQKDLYDPLPKKVLDKFQNSECNENIHKNNDEGITCSDLWH